MTVTVVVGALVIVMADIWVRAIRLRVLCGGPLTTREAVVVNQLGEAASAVTPARIGGEPVRFAELKRLGHGTPTIVAVLLTERLMGWVLIAVVIATTAILAGPQLIDLIGDRMNALRSPIWGAVGVLLVLAVGASWLWASRRRQVMLQLPQGIRAKELNRSVAQFATAVGLTALSMGLRTAVLPILTWSLIGPPLGVVAFGSFVLLYSQTVLPTPSGVGVVEAGFVAGLGSLGDAATIASLLIAWRVLTTGVGGAIGAWIMIRRGARWSTTLITRGVGNEGW